MTRDIQETWEVLKESPLWDSLTPVQKMECLKEVGEHVSRHREDPRRDRPSGTSHPSSLPDE